MVLEILAGLTAYGYLGAFIISFIGSASFFLPVPFFVIIVGLSTVLDPFILLLVTTAGAGLGEIIGYYIGKLIGAKALRKKKWKFVKKMEGWFMRNGFLTLVFLAAGPIPTDIGGLMAGALGYDRTKFIVAMVIGKAIKFSIIIYSSYLSVNLLVDYFGGTFE